MMACHQEDHLGLQCSLQRDQRCLSCPSLSDGCFPSSQPGRRPSTWVVRRLWILSFKCSVPSDTQRLSYQASRCTYSLFRNHFVGTFFNLGAEASIIIPMPIVEFLIHLELARRCGRGANRAVHFTAALFFSFVANAVTCMSAMSILLPEVRHLIHRVRLLALPELCKRPWSLRGSRRMAMAFARPPGSLRGITSDASPSFPVQCHGPWSCRPPPRGGCREAASRKDTRQELGPWFNFEAYAVCRVSFNGALQASGLKGAVPGTCGHSSAHVALGACDRMCSPRGIAASGSRSAQLVRGRRPENRPDARGADRARTPRRVTIPRTPGQRPKDRQATLRFDTAGDYALM